MRKVLGEELPGGAAQGQAELPLPAAAAAGAGASQDLFTGSEHDELEAIRRWAQSTRDGTLSDLDFQPSIEGLAAGVQRGGICTARHCGPRGNCFFQEARKAAAEARLMVVNHTLFFALLEHRRRMTRPPPDAQGRRVPVSRTTS